MMRGLIAVAVAVAPGMANAQSALTTGLQQAFLPVAEVENLANTMSCTALYRALSLLVGSESDLQEQFREREGFMASLSAALWVAAEGDEAQSADDVFAVLLPPIDTATDLYLAHMDAVTSETDAPFDDEILNGVEFCNAIFETLQSPSE